MTILEAVILDTIQSLTGAHTPATLASAIAGDLRLAELVAPERPSFQVVPAAGLVH